MDNVFGNEEKEPLAVHSDEFRRPRVDDLLVALSSLALCPGCKLIPTEQSQQTDTQTSTRTLLMRPPSSSVPARFEGSPLVLWAAYSPVTSGAGKRDLKVWLDWLWFCTPRRTFLIPSPLFLKVCSLVSNKLNAPICRLLIRVDLLCSCLRTRWKLSLK